MDFSRVAAAKILVHAAAHAESSVVGVLLAEEAGEGTGVVQIRDAVPLFHTPPSKPVAERALSMVDTWARSQTEKLYPIGVYYGEVAGEMMKETAIALAWALQPYLGSSTSRPYLAKLSDMLGVDGKGVLEVNMLRSMETIAPALEGVTGVGKEEAAILLRRFALGEGDGESEEDARSRATASLRARTLVDMDDALDDPTADWTNPHFNKALE